MKSKYSSAHMRINGPIACDLSALNEQEQQRRSQLASRLLDAAHEIVSVADGYMFRFDEAETDLREVAEFISLERRCCPFLELKIEIGNQKDSIDLHIHGREGVKEFVAAELGINTSNPPAHSKNI